ncbi:MAG: M20 family metallo-hydrolase [Trueperaceae bacterium]
MTSPGGTPLLAVNTLRVRERIERLAALTESGRPYTRRAFTDLFKEARGWLGEELRGAGLEPSVDAGGNLVGRRPGSDSNLPALAAGSHIDTVVGGGRFDGIAGVVAALEAAHTLHENGVELRHPLWVFDFLSEEPSDYGASCVGSRALVGALTAEMLEATNPAGEPLAEAIERVGGDPRALTAPLVEAGELAAFLELHIEQGPVLEREGKTIGLVEGIVAIHRLAITVRGQAAHAGTMPMNLRRDALVGASRLVQDVSQRAREIAERESFVATVGRFDVLPNGANVVPGEVRMIVEARSLDEARVEEFLEGTRNFARTLAPDLDVEVESLSVAPPARSHDRLLSALERGCQRRGHDYRQMTSGAGHDAMQVARIAPIAMLFIPCSDGVSHNPAEDASYEDVAAGAEVILEALLELDASL